MAKSGNTWCKKLMTKAKKQALKSKLGNEQGLLSRGKGTYWEADRMVKHQQELMFGFERGSLINNGGYLAGNFEPELDDKALPTAPKARELAPLPRVAGWKPKAFGKKIASRW